MARARIGVNRRKLLAGSAATAALLAAPSMVRAQTGPPARKVPMRSSRDRLEEALARIADPNGEGARACLTVYAKAARSAADAADARARAGTRLGPLDGTIISIKDLFDVAGEPTRAGSKVLADAAPATADAPILRRLHQAGGVILAKTNMVEFAFSGIGLNPHYGTPGNPADRARVPGGSSSGAAVAVADGMCEIAIGTDTAGSTRIPAALCGIVGYKPSKFRVPTEGAFPLSTTLDSVGPLSRSVADCAAADAVMAGDEPWAVEPQSFSGLRLGIVQGVALKDLDQTVATRFASAVDSMKRAGVRLSEEALPILAEMARVNAKASFSSVESYAIHRQWLATRAADYDPNVRARIELGRLVSRDDYKNMIRDRAALVRGMDARLADLDGLVLPTSPIVAPTIAEVSKSESFLPKNLLILRNTAFANFFDLCAISLPLPREGGLPVGLMVMARNGQDKKLVRIAAALERMFAA